MTSKVELEELAAQLRQPHGAEGIAVANMMNESNIGMTRHSIDRLNILERDHILELGHGNCSHLPYLLKQQHNLTYSGLEVSELMSSEAQRMNKAFMSTNQVLFHLYDGINIPFQTNSFDKIFTVNTIYFWINPELLLTELYRVMKQNGILNITFAQKSFMQNLPFTQFGFELYDNEKITRLIDKTPFEVVDSDTQTEAVKTKTGELIERDFTTISLGKN
jgi:SAM-dependent methyltransferase